MGLAPEILTAITDSGYKLPTPIQEKAIPILLGGRDIMGCAQTGTGKTAAFALPILQKLRRHEPGKQLRALILVPTRELAIQVAENIQAYGVNLDLRTTAVYGGVPIGPQEKALRAGVDILVATPGRLFDHMWRANIDYRDTEVLVLDEADRMLDMGFYDDVMAIVREVPSDRHTMLFSATLSPEICRLAAGILRNPATVEVAPPSTTVEEVEQIVMKVSEAGRKRQVLEGLIRQHRMQRALIFTRTKRGASSLSSFLRTRGYRATSIHSDKTQEARVAALEGFREGRVHLLVATDIAARGLDVDGITHVINFDVPHSPDDYVHRIGRTARAGRRGIAISLVSPIERKSFEAIEKRIGVSLRIAEAVADTHAAPSGRTSGHERPRGARTPAIVSERGEREQRPTLDRREPRVTATMEPAVATATNDPNGRRRRRRRRRRQEDAPVAPPVHREPERREPDCQDRGPLIHRVLARVRSMVASSA